MLRKAASQSSTRSDGLIQRAANAGTVKSSAASETTPELAKATGLIVEDDAKQVSTGQLRKSEFLSLLRNAVSATAAETSVSAGSKGSSYVAKWITDAAAKDSRHLEHALQKYAPDAAGARTARDYVQAVLAQVQRGVDIWTTTGEITGLPPKLAKDLPASTTKSEGEDRVHFKKEEGGQGSDEVTAIREQLSGGTPLGGGVRGQMERAYGASFSNVKVHTDAKASELSASLNARAFTIGNDIAFGAGEFRPGTLIGDALIAHELAHVVQQDSVGGSSGPTKKSAANYGSLEDDADVSAVGAIVSIWGGAREGLAGIARSALPRLRSGLKLQRCNGDTENEKPAKVPTGPIMPEESKTPKTPPTATPEPAPTAPLPDLTGCKSESNRKKIEEIIKTNPRKYDLTVVVFHIHKIISGDVFDKLAKDLLDKNTVTGTADLSAELQALNKGIDATKIGNCVVLITGWVSLKSIEKAKRENCDERIKEFKADASLKQFKDWESEQLQEKDTYESVVTRVAARKAGLFEGRKTEYAKLVEGLNKKWIGEPNKGECVALPVGWKDPNIGKLPAKPAAGTLKKTDPIAQAIAVVYSEQTRTSTEAGPSANFKEQQKYIWFSIRKRVEGAGYPPSLKDVLDPGQYHAIGGSNYTSALKDLEANDPPKEEAVKNAKQIVLENWTASPPADAGAGYFHWRKDSTPDKCFAAANKANPKEKEKNEKECAWKWAKEIDIVGSVSKTDGWLKRIRAAGDDPAGSMYIYPGNTK